MFVCSMGDLFHGDERWNFIAAVLGVMARASQHIFQVLTKRPNQMLEWHRWVDDPPSRNLWVNRRFATAYCAVQAASFIEGFDRQAAEEVGWPLPNDWLGVSAVNQARADERILLLSRTPAAVRFVSCEPMLGPVDLWTRHLEREVPTNSGCVDWVICGGETGPGARPMDPDWARDLRAQCAEDGRRRTTAGRPDGAAVAGGCAVKFFAAGTPRPKGNHIALCPRRRTHHHGHATPCRPFVTEDIRSEYGKKVAAWERTVRVASREVAQARPLAGPVHLAVCFYIAQPKSQRKEPFPPFAKSDYDKLLRTIGDAIQAKCDGYLIEDDKQVVSWGGAMRWADERGPGVEVEVVALNAQQGILF